MLQPSYKPLKYTLVDRGITMAALREGTGIAPNTFTKMNKNEWIALNKLAQICEYLKCGIEDVVEFVDENGRPMKYRPLDIDVDELL